MTVIDCVKSPPVDAMRAAGVTGLLRYLSWTGSRDTLGKVIHQPEYDQLRAAGFDLVLNWEFSASDWLGGASAGQAHAAEAVRQASALGYAAGCAIPGSADFNMTLSQWNTSCASYARAYSQGIRAGGYVAGVYGPWDVLTWCQQLGGFGMFWQSMSTAWSGGRNAHQWPGAHLWQRRSGFVGGFGVDFNDVLQADWGQYGVDAANTGGTMADFDPSDTNAWQQGNRTASLLQMTDVPSTTAIPAGEPNKLAAALRDIQTTVHGLSAPAPAPVDPAALKAALLDPEVLAALAKAVNDDAARRLAQ